MSNFKFLSFLFVVTSITYYILFYILIMIFTRDSRMLRASYSHRL